MRLFTAIDLPAEVRDRLDSLIGRLRPCARVKWVSARNLHITTKFIGEWPESRLRELESSLAAVARPGAIPISVRNIGWFPNPKHPRVMWAGVAAGPGLERLALATDTVCGKLGIATEVRAFSPHLTLARISEPVPLNALCEALANETVDFGDFTADSFTLYLSQLAPAGARYTPLVRFPLTEP